MPHIVYYDDVLIFSALVENDPRGPDGEILLPTGSVAEHRPNHEVFFATFVDIPNQGYGVLFLTDPLRSNGALTEKGVPGSPAGVGGTTTFGPANVKTYWMAAHGATDMIKFSAEYPATAITARGHTPNDSTKYLNCMFTETLPIIYRSLPLQALVLFERNQFSKIELPKSNVDVRLRVRHHDAEIQTMFNAAGNRPSRLYEFDRVVRFEYR